MHMDSVINLHSLYEQRKTHPTIFEDVLLLQFIPAFTDDHIYSDVKSAKFALPVKFGGLGLQNVAQIANLELSNYKEII